MAKKFQREVLIALADTHGGHRLGLLNPETVFIEYEPDEEGKLIEYEEPAYLNPAQEWLWKHYTHDIEEAFKLAGRDPVTVIVDGDITNGNKYAVADRSYVHLGNQVIIAADNLDPILRHKKQLKALRLVWGTDSHEGGDRSATTIVHRIIKAENKGLDLKSYGHGLMNLGGVWIDFAHHGSSPGIRHHTEGNAMRWEIGSELDGSAADGDPLVHLYIRAHFHRRSQVSLTRFYNDVPHTAHGIILPPYQLLTHFARQVVKSPRRSRVGLAAVEIINKEIYKINWFVRSRENRVREIL